MDALRATGIRWTRERAALAAVVCLTVGITGGWLIRGLQPAAGAAPGISSPVGTQTSTAAPQAPDAERMKLTADAQAAPLLEQLKSDPKNAELLINIGNLYYDAKQYPLAVDFYGRALEIKPSEASVRTDRGTAYWYMGNADLALSEFDKALQAVPDNPNTLFNRGLVRWQGKHDGAGALADWKRLLATDPNYLEKDKVQQMMREVTDRTAAK
jgi:tetratricopeptide (TPR) repeat protein